ncbi:MAG: LysR family transcriptional regulator ArgP [Myxococcota bacterium]
MQLGAGQLAALLAVLREGSFDAAAKTLHVTSPAVSQRIKQLEEQVGAVLVVRSSPCTATPTGEAVYRHALQIELLERDLMATLAPDATDPTRPPLRLSIAVNADSLATWLVAALAPFTAHTGARVDIRIDDEDDTTTWLRSGKVLGAVTSNARAVQGCDVRPLGIMRYQATASPRFVRRWLADGTTAAALREAPCLAYNRKDRLCAQFVARARRTKAPVLHPHFVPSPNAYVEATLRGVGWGMNPESLVAPHVRRGRLVDLFPGQTIDVPLYWQQWSIASQSLAALASALRDHAAQTLR